MAMTIEQAQNAVACICDGNSTPEQVRELNDAAFERQDGFLALVGEAFAFSAEYVQELIDYGIEVHFPTKEEDD